MYFGIIEHIRFKKVRQLGATRKFKIYYLFSFLPSFKNTTAMNRSSCPGQMKEQIESDSQEQAQKDRTFTTYLKRSSETSLKANASKHLFEAIFSKSTSRESLDNTSLTTFSLTALNEIAQLTAAELSQQGLLSNEGVDMKNSPQSLFQRSQPQKGHGVKIHGNSKQFFQQYKPIRIIHRQGLRQLFIIQSTRESKKKIMKMTFKVRFEGIYQILGQNEILNFRVLQHPGLPRLTQVYQECNKYMLVFDYIEGITLAEFIHSHEVTEQIGRAILRQILETLNYLHDHSLVHGKITPENIYVSDYQNNSLNIKIHFIDLSTTRPPRHFGNGEGKNGIKQDPFAPPEATKGIFNTKNDIWSVGILAIALFAKINKFKENSELFFDSLIEKSQVYRNHIKNIPDNVVLFINHMLIQKPINRPTAAQALKHTWLANQKPKLSSGHRRIRQQPFISYK